MGMELFTRMTIRGAKANVGSIQEENVRKLAKDLENLMEDAAGSDFEIVCAGGEVVKCHKEVLKKR